MIYDLDKLKKFRAKFHTGANGLKLGSYTDILIRELKTEPVESRHPLPAGDTQIRIVATVQVSAVVTLSAHHRACSICGSDAPPPSTADALWYILENHDGARLVFAGGEDLYDDSERDSYPVEGWEYDDNSGLLCPGCAGELEQTRERIRARVKGVAK